MKQTIKPSSTLTGKSPLSTQALSSFVLGLLITVVTISGGAAKAGSADSREATSTRQAEKFATAMARQSDAVLKYFLDRQQIEQLHLSAAARSSGSNDSVPPLLPSPILSKIAASASASTTGSAPKQPVPFYNKANSGDGGLASFHGHIFSEGFFRQHIGDAAFSNAAGGVATRKLIPLQPWFEWNESLGEWVFHESGAPEMILKDLLPPSGSAPQSKSQITADDDGFRHFFRGTTLLEWHLIRSYQLLSREILSRADQLELTNVLKSLGTSGGSPIGIGQLGAGFLQYLSALGAQKDSLPQATSAVRSNSARELFTTFLTALTHARKDSVFLTPNQRSAQAWVKTALIEWPITAVDLSRLVRHEAIYAGIEYEYVEIAAATREALELYFLNARFVDKSRYLAPSFDDE